MPGRICKILNDKHGLPPLIPTPEVERPAPDLKPGTLLTCEDRELVFQATNMQSPVIRAVSN